MSEKILVCMTRVEGERTVLLSPAIGRVMLCVAPDHVVSAGQTIGELWRLNQRFSLRLPEDISGKIVGIRGSSKILPLAYGEAFIEIAPHHHDEKIKAKAERLADTRSLSVDAPMDGMFYLSPSPKDPPYVKIGDTIAPGQTIGLIEVMKCFFPLKYQGAKQVTIIDIKVKSATPVSLGTKLFGIQ